MTSPTRANDVLPTAPVRHGAYFCLTSHARALGGELQALARRLELRNEFEPGADHPRLAIAFLRRVAATPRPRGARLDAEHEAVLAAVDADLLRADAIVHVAAPSAEPVAELARVLAPAAPRVIGGEVRPLTFTGAAMHNYSYAHRVLQQPGRAAPHAFLVPMSKTSAWWAKDWMERHTYFLPRYDDGRMVSQGHALATQAGIAALMRRTYRNAVEPAPPGAYDFATYFECADDAVATFHEVCAALRDVARNPEWAFVREGPTWQGRRVASWDEMFA